MGSQGTTRSESPADLHLDRLCVRWREADSLFGERSSESIEYSGNQNWKAATGAVAPPNTLVVRNLGSTGPMAEFCEDDDVIGNRAAGTTVVVDQRGCPTYAADLAQSLAKMLTLDIRELSTQRGQATAPGTNWRPPSYRRWDDRLPYIRLQPLTQDGEPHGPPTLY
jgi:hypothetical protein